MYALFLKEIRSFLNSLIGYITISIFLLATGLFMWVFSGMENVFEMQVASLYSLFYNAPIILMFIIPAITMRSFAEEKRTGTIELLFTKPISDTRILLGKYFAGFFIIIIALLPTLIYYASIVIMGDPPGNIDDGGTLGGYIGLFFIAAIFLAIGVFCSACTKNQVISFLFSLVLCFIFYQGFDLFGTYSTWGTFDGAIQSLGIRQHYNSLQKGVLDTRDLAYFISLTVTFLILTRLVLQRRKSVSYWKDFLQAIIMILIVGALNLIGFIQYDRIDLTEDGIHSMTDGFTELLENDMEHIAYVKVYLEGDDFPAQVENLRRNVEDKLIEFNHVSGGMVKYEFIDPDEDPELAEELIAQLMEAGLSVKMVREINEGSSTDIYFWPGAIIEYGQDKTAAVQFIPGGMQMVDNITLSIASDQLEYNFMQAFRKLTRKKFPHVGFLQGHGELEKELTYSIRGHLNENYKVDEVALTDSLGKELIYALDDYEGLIVAQPKEAFTDRELFILDQFIMNGGRVAWLIDPLNMQEDSLFKKGQTIALPYELNIQDMLFNYGARINNELIVTDNSSIMFNFQTNQPVSWNFYALASNYNRDPVAANLNPVKMKYVSPVDPVGDESIKKRILLETSAKSKVFKKPARVSLAYLDKEYKINYTGEGVGKRTTAMMLEGNFQSFFKNSIDPAYKNNPEVKFTASAEDGKMLVVGDADFVVNMIRRTKNPNQEINPETDILSPDFEPVAETPYPAYSNVDFFSNAFDDLMEQDNIIALRGRESKQRPLSSEWISDKTAKSAIKFMNVAFPLLLLVIFGVIQYLVRRAKFARR